MRWPSMDPARYNRFKALCRKKWNGTNKLKPDGKCYSSRYVWKSKYWCSAWWRLQDRDPKDNREGDQNRHILSVKFYVWELPLHFNHFNVIIIFLGGKTILDLYYCSKQSVWCILLVIAHLTNGLYMLVAYTASSHISSVAVKAAHSISVTNP